MNTTNDISNAVKGLTKTENSITELKRKNKDYQSNINSLWVSNEMKYLNEELDSICRELTDVGMKIADIGDDVLKVVSISK